MDRHSDSTGVSPTPFSPFSSNNSMGSEGGTSDEPADLGQMAAVFEAFRTEFAPRSLRYGQTQGTRVSARGMARPITPTSSLMVSPSDGSASAEEGEGRRVGGDSSLTMPVGIGDRAGVPGRLRTYSDLNYDEEEDEDDSGYEEGESLEPSYAHVQGRLLTQVPEQDLDGIDQPSLGYLDGVLGFLAAERAKFTAQREAGLRGGLGLSSQASTSESAWRHVVEPRRRRRRKRPTASAEGSGGTNTNGRAMARGMGAKSRSTTSGTGSTGVTSVDGDIDLDGDNEGDADAEGVATPVGEANERDVDGSSSGEYWVRDASRSRAGAAIAKSMPSTPPKGNQRRSRTSALNGKGKGKERAAALQANAISSSSRPPPVSMATQPQLQLQEQAHQAPPKLSHSRSTPSLRLAIHQAAPPDARVLQLRTLATKLRMFFTEDAKTLSSVLLNDSPEEDGFIDPRGRPAREGDPLVHVFIDHSNILIGFLNYLRRFPPHSRRPKGQQKPFLSHTALSLILERGRPISRRVLATSSPLYQPMDSAERLGYDVKVYARVPDTGTGLDRERSNGRDKERDKEKSGKRNSSVSRLSGAGNASADSDPGPTGMLSPPTSAGVSGGNSNSFVQGHSRSSSLNVLGGRAAFSARRLAQNNSSGTGSLAFPPAGASPSSSDLPQPPPRIRYREQGVDELLQLKLHQALSSPDPHPPPPNSTIVLATGDGNVGQFNEEGFLGCVRTALRKGWRVELYAWEGGLSRSWVREFGGGGIEGEEGGEWGDRFKIVGLEKFAHDLLVVY